MTRSAALLAILLLILSESVFAGEAVEREYSFSTSDPDGKYAEHKVISIEGKKYKAVDWDYTTTGSTPNVVKKKYKNLTHESVPESLTKDGEEYTLEDRILETVVYILQKLFILAEDHISLMKVLCPLKYVKML